MSAARRSSKAPESLTARLSRLLAKVLVPDLRERTSQPDVHKALTAVHKAERAASHTGEPFIAWRDQLIEQVGSAWILSCVFVRTLEDRDLLAQRRLAGPGATDSEQLFFELFPHLTHRDYLLAVFREVSRLPGAEDLLGPRHNPVWKLSPSEAAARTLLQTFREPAPDGTLALRFGGPSDGNDTRFLGDLYQDLSESVRKRYALLQTPDFVESFILDRTLTPALETFGTETVRLIDPTCGSGHFLLGAFARLVDARKRLHPGLEPKTHAAQALTQIYGVDLNPYAVAITRFRLTLAFLAEAGLTRLSQAPRLSLNLVVADSLLHGASGEQQRLSDLGAGDAAWKDRLFALDDPEAARRVFNQRYHAVVGNPPYITCKDAVLRDLYRTSYTSAAGKYALSAPFCERIFQLAVDGGFTGQITSNSFMKREFGKKLVEEVLPKVHLTEIIDAAGAYIPGHGTPTVILFGRNQSPISGGVVAVLGKRGEPSTPEDPAKGEVWSSIAAHAGEVGYEDEYLSVAEMARDTLEQHPWSLGGGGAADVKEAIEEAADSALGDVVESIGFGAITAEDDVFGRTEDSWVRLGVAGDAVREFGIGEGVRDWSATTDLTLAFPYDRAISLRAEADLGLLRNALWPFRTLLFARRVFAGTTYRGAGRAWYQFHQIPPDRYRTPLSITFAFVATHNHFVLDRGGKVFNRSAPIIKLPPDATEEDHLALLGYLNSSTACFWMKQVFQPKGGSGMGRGIQAAAWMERFEHDGTKLHAFPLSVEPTSVAPHFATALAHNAESQSMDSAEMTIRTAAPSGADALDAALDAWRTRQLTRYHQMVGLQEELDWACYAAYGLFDDYEALPPEDVPPLDPAHRAFEVILARESGLTDEWFVRHGRNPITDTALIPDPRARRQTEARLQAIAKSPALALIETPTYKRRWSDPAAWSDTRGAETTVLLDLVEATARDLAAPISVRELAMRVGADPAVTALHTRLGAGVDLSGLLTTLLVEQSVPDLAAERFKDSGLEKHAAWQSTWELQRREDAGESVGAIPVPPKYGSGDYRRPEYWRLRGKLDVPKERFISYPGAERDDDPSPVLGWAGWDHLQRARALAGLYLQRKTEEGWDADRLTPLLAGLNELTPWLTQWHNAPDPDFGGERMGQYFERFVESESRSLGLTERDLQAWRPEAGRKRRS
jgi:hypothetical protein